MRGLCLSTIALAWLAACGPGGNRAGRAGTGATGNEIGMTRDTGPVTTGVDTGMRAPGAAAGAADSMDAAGILTTLTTANMQEIQEANYVQQHARSAAVKSLARKLETDHKANLRKGRQLASQLGVSQRLPTDSAQTNAAPAQLQGLTGAALDSVYVARQVEAHQANIDRIRNRMIPAAQDAKLKQYLQQTVTGMEGHLRQAQQVQRQLGKS